MTLDVPDPQMLPDATADRKAGAVHLLVERLQPHGVRTRRTKSVHLAGLGFFNVKTSEPFAGGKLRIVLENVTEDSIGGDSRKVGLVTVRTEVADDVRRRLAVVAPRVSGYRRRLVREDDARSEHTTFLEKYERAGFKVIIR